MTKNSKDLGKPVRQLLLILTLTLINFSSLASDLPDLGATDLKDYDSQTETTLGKAFSTALHQQYDLFYDPVSISYIRRIGEKITGQTGQARPFSFFIVNDDNINAFAGPNGVIGINTGLISAAESEDELASVVAHETAHVTQRHLSRSYEYQNNLSVASIASIIAALLVGSQDPAAGIATYMGTTGLTMQQQLKNSRIHESEADFFGIKYLNKAGYNPYAMSDFFGRLEKAAQLYEFQAPEILRTHPVTANRLAKAKDRAQQLSQNNTYKTTETLKLIQLRIKLLNGQTITPFVEKQLPPIEKCYLNNLKHEINPNRYQPDLKCLETAIKKSPNQRLLLIQQAQISFKQSPEQGNQKFKYLLEIFPSDFSITLLYASALEKAEKLEQATDLLQSQTPKYHYQYLLYSKLASLFAKQNSTQLVYYYDALANYNIGNSAKALHLVKQAKKLESDKKSKLYEKLTRFEKTVMLEIQPQKN